MSRCRLPFVIIVIALFLLLPEAVSANGGPLFDPADAYGNLRLDENSNISLVREKVTYTIQNDIRNDLDAAVSVQYELKNKSADKKEVTVLFLTPAKVHLQVKDGTNQSASVPINQNLPINWSTQQKDTVTDPVSGRELPLMAKGKGEWQTEGAQFSLSFEPGESKEILIQYRERGGMYDKGVVNTIFSHLYYLTPAEFWEGDPQVELEVVFSKQGSKLHSNLPLQQINANTYMAKFGQLPEEEWYFSYTYPHRLLFPTNVEKEHNLLVLAAVLVFTALAAGASRLYRNLYIFMTGAVFIFLFTIYYISKMGGYPFNAIFVGFTDLVVAVMLILCGLMIRKKTE